MLKTNNFQRIIILKLKIIHQKKEIIVYSSYIFCFKYDLDKIVLKFYKIYSKPFPKQSNIFSV